MHLVYVDFYKICIISVSLKLKDGDGWKRCFAKSPANFKFSFLIDNFSLMVFWNLVYFMVVFYIVIFYNIL